jgi:hypothetical protein
MPVIKKKKVAKKPQAQKKTKKARAVNKKVLKAQAQLKHSVAYYDCCANETKQKLKGVKITQICHHCKHNSQKYMTAKVQEREEEKQKIALA